MTEALRIVDDTVARSAPRRTGRAVGKNVLWVGSDHGTHRCVIMRTSQQSLRLGIHHSRPSVGIQHHGRHRGDGEWERAAMAHIYPISISSEAWWRPSA